MEQRVEQQLVGRAVLRPEVYLAGERDDVAAAHSKGDHVGLIAEQILPEQPSTLEDRTR
jgi:hypothetical protein